MSDDPHAPLREDVKLLGRLLGEQLIEQGGTDLFDTVERIRRLAKDARAAGPSSPASSELDRLLAALPVDRAFPVARAFAHFLTLANIAEQHHRGRRRRTNASAMGSFDRVLADLSSRGSTPDRLHATASQIEVELVLTAHPTEVVRRTLLMKHRNIEALLREHERLDLTGRERERVMTGLRREIAGAWASDELRRERPTPEDEARSGFAVIESVLWDVVPAMVREFDAALRRHTGRGLALDAAPIRLGSWMGGDRDGNPNVTAEVTRRVLLLGRWMAADLYLQEIRTLRRELSMNVADDALRAEVGEAWEPYREVLRGVETRLEATREWAASALDDRVLELSPPSDVYVDAEDLARPLRVCHRSLHRCRLSEVADGRLLDTLRRIVCFGLTLVRLDLRQDASRHTEALDEITRALGLGSYAAWSEPERRAFLERELTSHRRLLPRAFEPTAAVREVLDTFAVAARAPASSLGAYVISMAAAPSDVLAVALLQREMGNRSPQRVVPLFETVEDLDAAADVVDALLAIPLYRELIGGHQEVMIGYSDSAKRAGRLAAAWSLYRAQERLVEICRRQGVGLTLFHGRGGSVGRGGGNTYEAILSQPPGAITGRLRVTEQGEVIHAKFGFPEVASRSLELYLTATLEATLFPAPEPQPTWRAQMEELANTSRRAFEAVVGDPRFVDYFRTATPEAELARLNIGSRPAHRGGKQGLASLRAIPWVFAWTQTRLMLPAWLGVGEALQAAIDAGRGPILHEMLDGWPAFETTLSMIAMVLAKASPEVARRYDRRLVPAELADLGADLLTRLDRTRAIVERVLERPLLADNPLLERSIVVRNPYIDPLNLLQVEYLARVRAHEQDELVRALLITINGIAAGMRNTG